jgi:predicted Zn-dependent peptidase
MTLTLVKTPVSLQLNRPTLHRLPNGLTIIGEQIPVEAVNLNLWLNVGSAIESDAINGMAHFLEHMVFKGTDTLESGEFERLVEERGAVTNAATSQDYTHYYITTAPKDFADLAPLLVDVVTNPSIPDDGFERERFVVLEEIRRSQDNPRRRTFRRASELTFNGLPYGRQVLGPASVIEQLAPQQMRDFHAHWYQPQSITAVAVGNLPVDKLIQIVADSFTSVRPQDEGIRVSRSPLSSARGISEELRQGAGYANTPHVSSFAPEDPFSEIVRRQFIDPTLQQARLVMTWRVPGLKDLNETYAMDVLASILGHGRTARLFQDLREDQGLVSSISASNMTYQHQGAFYISAHLPAENLERVEAAIAQHIQRLQEELISAGEIARMRAQVANHFVFGNETPSDRSGLYGYYQSLVGDLAPALNYPARIQSLEAAEMQTAAQRYLSADAYGLVVIQPSE